MRWHDPVARWLDGARRAFPTGGLRGIALVTAATAGLGAVAALIAVLVSLLY